MAVSYIISHKVMTVQGTFLLYSYWQALKKKIFGFHFTFFRLIVPLKTPCYNSIILRQQVL